MTVQYYLSVSGFGGDSTNPDYKGFFDVAGFSLDESASVHSAGGGLPETVSPPQFGPLEVSFSTETGMTDFLTALARGTDLAGASLVGVQQLGGATQALEVYRVNLANLLVTNVSETSNGGYVVTLDYAQIGVTTHDIATDGTLGSVHTFNFDPGILTTTSGSTGATGAATGSTSGTGTAASPPDVLGGTPTPAVHPTSFYAAIQGLNGGSTDASHAGWFQLADFNLDAINQLASSAGTGGAGAGKASFGPITLHLSSQAALTSLMDLLSTGASVSGVRIEGMNSSTGAPVPVYDLTLDQAHITGVTQSSGGGLDVTVAYEDIELTTKAVSQTGSPPQIRDFSWDIANDRPGSTLATPQPSGPLTGAQPQVFYLAVEGVSGSVVASGYHGYLNVSDFSFDTTSSVSAPSGGAQSVSAPHYGPLQVTLSDEAGLATFLSDVASGSILSGASLVGLTSGPQGQETYRVDLADVVVTNVATGSNGSYVVTLGYEQIGVTTHALDSNGNAGSASTFGYDLATGQVLTNLPRPVSSPLPGAPVHPTEYYAVINGMDGGVTDTAHKGWFVVTNFNFDLANQASLNTVTGGAGAGKAIPSEITLHLPTQAALTDLLNSLASGATINDVRIEGMSSASGAPTAVYDLDLANVSVAGVSQSSDGGLDVSLAYSAIRLTTQGQNANGGATAASSFTWNFATNSSSASFATPSAGTTPSGGGANTYYLALDGVSGPSTATGYHGYFGVTGFDFSAGLNGPVSPTGGHPAPSFSELVVNLQGDAALSTFLADVLQGNLLSGASLVGVRTSALGSQETYRANLANVTVAGISETSDGQYSVILNYTQIGVTTHAQNPDGSLGSASTFGYDIALGKVLTAGLPQDVKPSGSSAAIAPSQFFVAIDGVHGGVMDTTHQGWFQVNAFSWGAGRQVVPGTTTTTQSYALPNLAPIVLHLENQAAVTGLLADLSHGTLIRDVRIEGVSVTSSAAGQAVYDMDLAGVHITDVAQNSGGGLDVTLAYTAIRLATVATGAGGTPVTTSFSWDSSTNAPGGTFVTPDTSGTGGSGSQSTPSTIPTGLADAAIVNGYVNAAGEKTSQLTGSADPGATVSLYDNGATTAIATATADSNGHFIFALSSLADGAHSLTVVASNPSAAPGAAGSGGPSAPSSPLVFTVDTHAPDAPAALADPAIVGGYVNAHPASASQLTGTAEAGATVAVYDNGGTTALATATADSNGDFTFSLSGLADGAHSLTVTATDAAGNVSQPSAPLVFIVDTQPPVAPSALADASIVNGYVNAAHEPTSQLTGAAEAGATVTLYDNGGTTALATATATTSGTFSFDLSKLADGAHNLTVTATDAAGNVSQPSAALLFTVDTQVAAPGVALAVDSGVAGDGITNNPALALSGIEAGASVGYSLDGGKTWTPSFTAVEGPNALEVRQTDLAGNVSTPTAFSFTLDTHPPAAPTGLALDPSTDSGIPFDRITNHKQVLIDGHAEAGSTVTLYDTDGQTVIGSGVADANGAFHITTSSLADGVHEISATATDVAGNTGAVSSDLGVTIDTTPPSPVVQDIVSHGGALISGTSEPLSPVFVYDNGNLVGFAVTNLAGQWSVDVHATGNVIHDYTLTAVDIAGNVGTSSGETLYSPAAHKELVGGAGNDVLIAQPNDTLTGGGGGDTFVFSGHFGKVTVTDFGPGDKLAFDHTVFSSYAEVMAHAHQAGSDTTISIGHGEVVTLHGVAMDSLHASAFVFI